MSLFVAVTLIAVAAAAPQQFIQDFNQDFNSQQFVFQPDVKVLDQRFQQDINGNYQYGYEQDNGQRVEEVGEVVPGAFAETGSIRQQGSYQFVADDGQTYQVSYVADENGFQPQGAHLPQPPAQIPEYAQLRLDHPELFWAENGGVGLVFSDQQFVQPQFDDDQFQPISQFN